MKPRLDRHFLRLARNTGWLAAGGVVSAILAAGQTVLSVRLLGSAVFGELALAVAMTGVILQFADFRTWEVAVRLVQPSESGTLAEESHGMVQALLVVDLAAGLLGTIGTWLLAAKMAGLVGGSASVGDLIRIYALAVPWILVSSGACVGVFRLMGRFRLLTIKSVVVSGTQFLLVAVALWKGLGAGGVATAYVVTEFGHAVASLFLVRRLLRERGSRLMPGAWSVVVGNLKAARRLLGQVWLSGTIKGLQTRLDIPLLGALSSPTAVTDYRLALDLAGVMSKPGNPVQQAILPELVTLEKQGDRTGVRRLTGRTSLALAVVIIPALVVIATQSETILGLAAGTEYRRAGPVFALVALGIGINTLFVWSRPLLVARMRIGTGNVIAIAGAALQLSIIAAFAGRWGAVAAGAGNAAMFIFTSMAGVIAGLR